MSATSDYLNRPVRSEREAQLEAENKAMRAIFAALGFDKQPGEERIGWRGCSEISIDHFACEFCRAEHLDCGGIQHADDCPVTLIRALSTTASKGGADELCEGCPPVGYPTEKTRCLPCPRRASKGGGDE